MRTAWVLCLTSMYISGLHAAAPETGIDNLGGNTLGGYGEVYQRHCAVCHGEQLQGAAQGKPLLGDLDSGDSVTALSVSIAQGNPAKGMPAWSATMTDLEIKNLALYISETRAGLNYEDFNYDTAFEVPTNVFESEKHSFRLRPIIQDLDPLPFSIAPLPDGRILLTEKKRGLSIISPPGEQSDYITGTPSVHDDTFILSVKQEWGYGWLLDVALHPDYAENGWIYLQFGDRCEDCNTISRKTRGPVSMNKLIRGHIKDGQWVDEQVIWATDLENYGSVPDIAAGGRIAFDDDGHVFISVGIKGIDNHTGIQDLHRPWGKIHRVYDDGRVPLDNPFMAVEGAVKSIWTYGHRSPQGLEFNRTTGDVWSTEMGPRGGDEINRLVAGKNYGWPLYSKGLNYDGSPVAYGTQLNIEFDLEDIVQPVVDLSPSPAVSSFIFYDGDAFPAWRGDLIVGSLKARTLYRMHVEDDKVTHTEVLIDGLSRFRDIETGPNGELYVLMEHNSGGQILELVSAPAAAPAPETTVKL